jgi:hypothetical protein
VETVKTGPVLKQILLFFLDKTRDPRRIPLRYLKAPRFEREGRHL